jgi:hypothetical protein
MNILSSGRRHSYIHAFGSLLKLKPSSASILPHKSVLRFLCLKTAPEHGATISSGARSIKQAGIYEYFLSAP